MKHLRLIWSYIKCYWSERPRNSFIGLTDWRYQFCCVDSRHGYNATPLTFPTSIKWPLNVKRNHAKQDHDKMVLFNLMCCVNGNIALVYVFRGNKGKLEVTIDVVGRQENKGWFNTETVTIGWILNLPNGYRRYGLV